MSSPAVSDTRCNEGELPPTVAAWAAIAPRWLHRVFDVKASQQRSLPADHVRYLTGGV
jgi:hypothetical protein